MLGHNGGIGIGFLQFTYFSYIVSLRLVYLLKKFWSVSLYNLYRDRVEVRRTIWLPRMRSREATI